MSRKSIYGWAGMVGVALLLVVAVIRVRERPDPVADAAPTAWAGTESWARQQLATMTLEEKAAQTLVWVGGAAGETTVSPSGAPRGILLTRQRYLTPRSADSAVTAVPSSSLPTMLMADLMEPGGSWLPAPFPALGASRDTAMAYAAGRLAALFARRLHLTALLVPTEVASRDTLATSIPPGAFSDDPRVAASFLTAFVRGVQEEGVLAVVYPPHPYDPTRRRLDPRGLIPSRRHPVDTLATLPYRAALRAGAMGAMLSPPERSVLPQGSASSASSPSARRVNLFRSETSFRGLLVADTRSIVGARGAPAAPEAAVRSLLAGAQLVIVPPGAGAVDSAIVAAVASGRFPEAVLDAAVLRILQARRWASLLSSAPASDRSDAIPSLRDATSLLSHASLTLLRNEHNTLPLQRPARRIYTFMLTDGDDAHARRYLPSQLRHYSMGIGVTSKTVGRGTSRQEIDQLIRSAASHDVVVVVSFLSPRTWRAEQPIIHLLASGLEAAARPWVLVSFGSGFDLPDGVRPGAHLVAFDGSEPAQQAVAQALFGRSPVTGRLPAPAAGYRSGSGINLAQTAPRRGLPEEVGMSEQAFERIDSLLNAAIAGQAFPGAAVVIGRNGIVVRMRGYGRYRYDGGPSVNSRSIFDLASLTKVVATTTAAMRLFDRGLLRLDDPVSRYLPEFGQNGKTAVTLRQLLSHSSGLPAFRDYTALGLETPEEVTSAILAEQLEYRPGTRHVYSDLGMIVLGLVIERIAGTDLGTFTRSEVFRPLGMSRTGFRSVGADPDTMIVPTEMDLTFRKRLIQGEVHDETAYLLGGTAGSAGLFSSAEDLAKFAFMLVNDGRIYGRTYLRPETIRAFTRRAAPAGVSTRALGWDTRDGEGYSSAGSHFGPASFGHTGFTGTSLWIDPDTGLYVILLTNRIYPSRENQRHLAVRARLADLAYEAITGPPRPYLPLPTRRP